MFSYVKFFVLDAEKVENPSLWKSSSLCETIACSGNVTYPRGLTFARILLLNSDENPVSDSAANIIWREIDRELFADLLLQGGNFGDRKSISVYIERLGSGIFLKNITI